VTTPATTLLDSSLVSETFHFGCPTELGASGKECYCDHVLRNGATADLIEDKHCGTPCTGNGTSITILSMLLTRSFLSSIVYENCGGTSTLTILAKQGVALRTINNYQSSATSATAHCSSLFVLLLISSFLVASPTERCSRPVLFL
jgi:hypothetical protein